MSELLLLRRVFFFFSGKLFSVRKNALIYFPCRTLKNADVLFDSFCENSENSPSHDTVVFLLISPEDTISDF